MSDVHGRKREKTSEEATRVRRQKEASKIKAYRDLVEKCRSQVKNGQFDADTLLLTTHILQQNPDFYTIWNYRRNILLRGILQQDPAKDRPVFCKELDFFMQVIRINPKSYWLWNHRLWCLQTMPDPDWKAELGLVEKMLAMDARNFHGWDYRRYVVKKLKANAVDEQEEKAIIKREYDFTTKKIYDNFSNYSAWHQRSKLLPAIVAPLSMEEKNQKAREELDLVKNAVYTDPNDQSAWLYYRWLIGHTPSTISVLGAFRLSGLDKIVLIFSRNVTLLKTPSITTVEGQSVNGQWCYANQRSNTNRVYIFNPTESLPQDITIRIFANSVAAAHSKFDSSWEGTPVQLATDSSITEIVAANLKNATEFSESRYTDLIENYHPSWYTLDRIELLNEEIQAVRDLLEEEPHSKWALETLAHFLEQLKLNDAMTDCQNINIEIMGIFEKLEELDLYRKQRYQDARNALKWDMDSHVVSEAYKKQSVTGKSAELLLEVFKQELCG